jgi:ATP-binding cassette, subfamily C, bacterial LapB
MNDITSRPSSWSVRGEALLPDDPLTRCLVILTRFFHNPISAQTLTAGLPLENMRLTPDLFVRAAVRAGLSARVVKRSLDNISSMTLPAVLLLKNGNACVVAERNESLGWVVIQPESGNGQITMTTEGLAEQYDGFAIFSRPSFQFDTRTADQTIPRGKHWFWSVFVLSWPLYTEVLIATFLTNVFALVTPLFVMNVYDRVVPNMAYETLWVLSIGALFVFIFDLLMRSLRGYFLDVAGKQTDVILSAAIFEKVLGLKSAVRPRSVGTLANSMYEFEMFRDFITSATITALIDLPFVVLFLGVIFWIGGASVIVPILAMPIIIGVALALQRPLQSIVKQSFRVSSQKQAMLIETLTGMDTIKAVSAEGAAQRKWEQIIGEQNRLSLSSRILSAAIVNQSSFFQQAAYIGVVIVGVYLIADRSLTTGGLIACALLTNRMLSPLSQVASLITRYFQAKEALAGIDNIMNLPVERPPGKSFVHRPGFQGDIEFRNVTFSYPEQEVAALTNVSFRIRSGERVGIIGRIGSGKTTIEKLLLGLYDPTRGSIWIDGIDLQQIDPADLRHNIGYVPQDVMLFHGSVRENIVLGAPYVDDAAMLYAAERAGVTEFVNRHPKGFDMQVGERGEGLSGGQRQSIANARALLLEPRILVLDEPSSSLDNRSEENLKSKLTEQLEGRTLILVTHRASLLTMVDRLIVMDGGRVIADGPKAQVMEALSGGKLNVAKQ